MGFVIGIDEVGRGSLAGPVMVCAALVMCQVSGIRYHDGKRKIPLRDSKKLTAKQREKWFAHLTAHPKIQFALARVYPKTIDRINISRAANLASLRAFRKLTRQANITSGKCAIYLDGGLYLGAQRGSSRIRTRMSADGKNQQISTFPISASIRVGNLRISATTVIRGDEKIPAITIASIIAKVTRDRLMVRLAKKHPHYGFEVHKGYGTLRHRRAIKKHGPSKAHRLTFLDFLKNSKPKRRNFSRKS